MFNFLNNPLETFKSFSYNYDLTLLSNTTKQIYLTSNIYSNNFFFSTNFFLTGNFILFLINLTGLFSIISIMIYFQTIKNTKSFYYTLATVILIQINLYILGIETFINTSFLLEGFWTLEDLKFKSTKVSILLEIFNSGIITSFFIKEIISFISLFSLLWLFANYSYNDTNLIPKNIIETIDELLYKKNLSLFSDTLNLKQDKHVKEYQEFFFKMHGILLFILISNVQGMVPYTSTITSSLVNTFFIASAIFVNILITILKEKGASHFFSLFLPSGCPFVLIFLLGPIEFISYSFRLISLSVRLFANMMAGHTLMKVIAGFSWSLILLGDHYIIVHYIPFFVLFLLTFLEIAVGFIQTYIFVVLVYIYLTDIFIGH
uniref:ATP synthase subunit a n=1 Tax=Cafileria marina TaxID=2557541 RepID=A0A5B9ILZ6_9STRA|nr:ATP synthase F0 subunit a [Cafileria marina]QEF30273.1 ATP synthase F0 subunit a [Cafileria marina]